MLSDPVFEEIEPRYGEIMVPPLILWGEADDFIPLERGRRLQEQIPGSTLQEISDAGHLVIEERPQALLREIRAFLAA